MKFLHDLLENLLKNIGDKGKVGDTAYSFSPYIVVKSIRALCISDRNRSLIVKADFLPLLIQLLKRFVNTEAALGTKMLSMGAGGADTFTASTTVEAMLYLSFEYDDDAELQAKFMTPNLAIKELMNSVIQREKLNADDIKNCKLLIGRLNPVVRSEVVPSVKVTQPDKNAGVNNTTVAVSNTVTDTSNTRRSHIMISYCWNAASKPEHSKEFGKQMRNMGYEIWRDEVNYLFCLSCLNPNNYRKDRL